MIIGFYTRFCAMVIYQNLHCEIPERELRVNVYLRVAVALALVYTRWAIYKEIPLVNPMEIEYTNSIKRGVNTGPRAPRVRGSSATLPETSATQEKAV